MILVKTIGTIMTLMMIQTKMIMIWINDDDNDNDTDNPNDTDNKNNNNGINNTKTATTKENGTNPHREFGILCTLPILRAFPLLAFMTRAPFY